MVAFDPAWAGTTTLPCCRIRAAGSRGIEFSSGYCPTALTATAIVKRRGMATAKALLAFMVSPRIHVPTALRTARGELPRVHAGAGGCIRAEDPGPLSAHQQRARVGHDVVPNIIGLRKEESKGGKRRGREAAKKGVPAEKLRREAYREESTGNSQKDRRLGVACCILKLIDMASLKSE